MTRRATFAPASSSPSLPTAAQRPAITSASLTTWAAIRSPTDLYEDPPSHEVTVIDPAASQETATIDLGAPLQPLGATWTEAICASSRAGRPRGPRYASD